MNVTGYPGYDRTAAAATRLRERLDTLARQSSSGMKADTYAGLGGADTRRSVSLRAEIGQHEALAQGISRAATRTTVGQTVLGRLGEIASGLAGRAGSVLAANPENARLIADAAETALREVAGLLNERVEGEYLFSGSDSANPPLRDAQGIMESDLVQAIRTAVAGLDGTNGTAIGQATRALAGGSDPALSPFSDHLGDPAAGGGEPRRSVAVEEGVTVEVGLFANRNAVAVSSGETTGSWARDLMHGLAVLASLGAGQAAQGTSFQDLVNSAVGSLRSAVGAIAQEQGALGGAQARLEQASAWHAETLDVLSVELAGVEEVDIAATITALQATRSQLQASYQSLAMLGDLSLANYLR